MKFSTFDISDLQILIEFQPVDWGDLVPRFQYFIDSPCCHPIKLSNEEEAVGIGTSIFHEDTAWLACIIVHANHRNKGLGNFLTQKLIDDIDRSKYQTIYLDATDFGYPVYKKLGFEVETNYIHLRKEGATATSTISEKIIPFRAEFKENLLRLDAQISGEKRGGILSDFLNSASLYVHENEVQGFYIPDWGDGPVIAKNDVAGLELMKLRCHEKEVAILPSTNPIALNFLEEQGYVIYKTSKRMILGKKRAWKANGIYNRISGQLG